MASRGVGSHGELDGESTVSKDEVRRFGWFVVPFEEVGIGTSTFVRRVVMWRVCERSEGSATKLQRGRHNLYTSRKNSNVGLLVAKVGF